MIRVLISCVGIFFLGWFAYRADAIPSSTPDLEQTIFARDSLEEVWSVVISRYESPTSITYDKNRQSLYVTHRDHPSGRVDNEGYVSVLDLNGNIKNPRWITGLRGPLAGCFYDDQLVLADYDRIVVVKPEEGTIEQSIPIPSSMRLSDIIYWEEEESFLLANGRGQRIYKASRDSSTGVWMDSIVIKGPSNFLLTSSGQLLVSKIFGDIAAIDLQSQEIQLVTNEFGRVGAMEFIGSNDTILTDAGRNLYRLNGGEPKLIRAFDKPWKTIIDMVWVEDQQLLIIVHGLENCISAYRFVGAEK